MTPLKQRIATAIVLVAGLLYALFGLPSSAFAWIALAVFVLGAREWLPGLFNLAFTLLTLLAVDRILTRRDVSARRRVAAGLALFFLVPLTVIASTGMEVNAIKDITPVPHNGCRPPKRRRV